MAFLVALIPGPLKYQGSFADGTPSPGFCALVDNLLAKLRSLSALDEAAYQAALAELRHRARRPALRPRELTVYNRPRLFRAALSPAAEAEASQLQAFLNQHQGLIRAWCCTWVDAGSVAAGRHRAERAARPVAAGWGVSKAST